MTFLDALKNYQQADADGVMVLVSRQACDEAAAEIERLRAENAKLWGLLAESAELAADLTEPHRNTSSVHIWARAVELSAKVRGVEQAAKGTDG